MKKGQITVFIVIGLVLAALVVLSFAFKDSIIEQINRFELTKGLTMTQEARKVQADMQNCVEDLAETGILIMGIQGGYTTLDTRVQYTDADLKLGPVPYFGTAYHYFKGQNLVPTTRMMEAQLSNFIEENMFICEAKYPGLEIDYGTKKNIQVTIQENRIKLDINLDVKVKKEETESGFKNLGMGLPVRLGLLQKIMDEIVSQQTRISEDEICISCISRIAAENELEVNVNKVEGDIFYFINDDKSQVAGHSFIFLLANKF